MSNAKQFVLLYIRLNGKHIHKYIYNLARIAFTDSYYGNSICKPNIQLNWNILIINRLV